MNYNQLDQKKLQSALAQAKKKYNALAKEKLSLDLSRGKPSPEMLDLSMPMLDVVTGDFVSPKGTDYRNYGYADGIPELKEVFADMLDVDVDNVMIGGTSSLNLIYDVVCRAYCFGVCGSTPWSKLPKVRFICPVPGYDRHFSILEQFGIEMIAVPMNEEGPDMDMVEDLVQNDQSIKGMFCVPRFSNPTGIVYSDRVVDRLINMKTLATDFRIFWDNAYCVHSWYPDAPKLKNVFRQEVNLDRFYMFVSTSKITFCSGGVSALICSEKNLASQRKLLSVQTINYDKINQYGHAMFLRSAENVEAHMRKHAEVMRPKFDLVISTLRNRFGDNPDVKWTEPKGGYFITMTTMPRCARRTIELCRKAGLKLTDAGCTHPLHQDDMDSSIRIAPSFASMEELQLGLEVLCASVELAILERRTAQ